MLIIYKVIIMAKIFVSVGDAFGRLVVSEDLGVENYRRFYRCICECGNSKKISKYALFYGGTKSCGCIKKAYNHPENYNPKTYRLWHTMIRRCYNKKTNGYESYGAKGVTVCDRWQGVDGFVNFMDDMKERPTELHSIDRIDGSKDYEPSNCKWSTKKEQSNNCKSNVPLTVNGTTLNICQWSERVGIKASTISERLKRGWSHERSVTTPTQKKYRKNSVII